MRRNPRYLDAPSTALRVTARYDKKSIHRNYFNKCFLETKRQKTYEEFINCEGVKGYPKMVPAMVADNNEANDPPKTAFIPKEESVLR